MIINNLGQIEHLNDGYITTNGAHCFVGEHVVCQYPISKTDVDRVVAVGGRDAILSSLLVRSKLPFVIQLL